jgi:multiple sugar transport system substrate-binding protein
MPTLRIVIRNYADFVNALEEEIRLFESACPGVHLELDSVGIHELHQSTIAEGGMRDGRFDLALLVTDWLAEGVASGALEDLHPWHAREPLADWPDGWAASLMRPLVIDGKLSSLPWHDGPECLVYRTDLFAQKGLTPPATWAEFEEAARLLTNPAKGIYGTVFAAFPDGHNTLYDFALQIWSRGGELADAAGYPQLTAPQAVEALDFYRSVVRDPALCHPQSLHLDSTQSGDLFLAGEVAMMPNWFGFAARSSRSGSPLAGKVAIAPVPSSPGCPHVSLSVFWAFAMAAGSRNKELAWQFLRFIASPERDLGITRHGAVGTRLSTWRNPALQAEIPAYHEIESISLGARQLPVGPQMAAFAAIIDAVITRALTTTDASTAILAAAQMEIEDKGIILV